MNEKEWNKLSEPEINAIVAEHDGWTYVDTPRGECPYWKKGGDTCKEG